MRQRPEYEELLDLGHGTPGDVAHNLVEMERINHYLGGYRALTVHLLPRLQSLGRPACVADVGAGAAGLSRLIAGWSRRHKLAVRVVAIDRAERHLAVAATRTSAYREIMLVKADAFRLPLSPGSIDYIVSSLILHHFAPAALSGMLRGAFEASRGGLVMTDLVRGWLPYFAFKLAQPAFAHNYLTRHDGAVSIMRAYQPLELLALARAAGLQNAHVYTHWPWRMTLVVDR
jgi:hypothetical protein